jgi:hypothetical protein
LALFVWIKNIFTPMYGQYDWQGRLISLFMRIVQIIFRGFVMLICVGIAVALLIIWIILPPFVVWQIFYQIIG